MKKFEYSKENIDDVTLVKMSGIIDEDCYLKDVFVEAQDKIAIDLSGITRVNSCGIRTWVNVMEQLTSEKNVIFIECSPVVMRQFNMIANFGGKGIVQSFHVPYFCEHCNKEFEFMAETRDFLSREQPLKVDQYKCSECNRLLVFDDIESKYFNFLSQYKK
jgi:anti-anti-sigma regulatory factor/DNA-directed RNA polymerase subunit RPC12/RpoP